MWWKFWTWGSGDTHQKQKGGRTVPNAEGQGDSHWADSDDILGSLSELIGDLPSESINSKRQDRSDPPVESIPITATMETFVEINAEEDPQANSQSPVDSASQPPPVSKPINSTPTSKPKSATDSRREFLKDRRQTLIVEEDKWGKIKGMIDSSKEIDEDDDDDSSGQSPYQTIVPSDD